MKDLRKVPTWPYIPLQWPPEGLIPARVEYLKQVTLWDAVGMGWSIKQPV